MPWLAAVSEGKAATGDIYGGSEAYADGLYQDASARRGYCGASSVTSVRF